MRRCHPDAQRQWPGRQAAAHHGAWEQITLAWPHRQRTCFCIRRVTRPSAAPALSRAACRAPASVTCSTADRAPEISGKHAPALLTADCPSRPDPSARVRRDCCLPARSRGRYETCAFHPVERRSSLALPRASCIAVRADSVRAGHSATSLLVANTRADPRTAGALALPPARNSRWTIPSSVWRKGMGLRHGSVGGWFARCDAVQRGALLHRSDGQGAVGDAVRGQLVQGSLEGEPARG